VLAAERVAIARAAGRVLATDAIAGRPLPGFDNSAMDGYAVRASELPGTFPIASTVAAGDPGTTPVPPGTCARILTGAPLPPGVDTVVMQENATRDGDRIALPQKGRGDNVRLAGEDMAVGAVAVRAGTRLTGWHLGALAALGFAEVPVHRAPRVAILGTGDELVDVTTTPGPGQLVDSSAYALAALVEEAGGIPVRLGVARDDLSSLRPLLAQALEHDVVITTGGVSVGDRDHVHAAFADAGIELALYKVAMKPGKPFSFAMRGATPVFGLPGNPVSTVVAYELFLRPALLAMQGATHVERSRAHVTLVGGYEKQAGRAHYLRATVTRDGDRLRATPHPKQGSAMLSSLIGTNALVELAAELTTVSAADTVPALLLEAV